MKQSFHILIILGLLLCCDNVHCFRTLENKTDSDTLIILKGYLDMIEKADSIVWYLLDPMSEDSTVIEKGIMGEILQCKTDTLEERCNALKSTLAYLQSFAKNDMMKESTFLPDVAICFFSKKGIVTFSYSFYCDICRFEENGKYQDTDGELIRKSIIQMTCENFPKDRYLRNLRRKEK